MKYSTLVVCIFFFSLACRAPAYKNNERKVPEALPARSFTACYNAAGFIRVNKEDLADRLPNGFIARDGGEILGEAFKGYAYLVLIYFSCPLENNSRMQMAIFATPVEDPSFAKDMRTVRWNWYEFGRISPSINEVEDWNALGFSAQQSDLHNAPFHEGDTITSFEGKVANQILFKVEMRLTDPVNFESQSHRLWHQRPDGNLVSTRWDFEYHHSWIGRVKSCSFNPNLFSIADLKGIKCSSEGITEAIEKINFTENMMVWR